jgi:hypothetical protein
MIEAGTLLEVSKVTAMAAGATREFEFLWVYKSGSRLHHADPTKHRSPRKSLPKNYSSNRG